MSDVPEAAASLFGSAEESADPFAVIGTDASAEGNDSAPNDLFPDDQSNFLDSTPQEQATNYQQSTYETHSSVGYQSATTGASWTQTDVVNEVHQYQYQQTSSYHTVQTGTTIGGQQSAYEPSTYQPYAPAAPAQNPATIQVSTADRYAPPSVAPATNQPTSYYPNDYSQPAPNSYSPYAPTNYATAPAPANAVAQVTAPPPPAPKVPVSRPKVVNAYDPPFPTTTRKPTRQASNSYGAYGAYQPVQPMPPPSPFYANNQFAAHQGHPPPPPASNYTQYGEPPTARAAPPPPPPAKSPPSGYGHAPPPAVPRMQTPDYVLPPRAAPRTQTPDYGPPRAAPRTQTPDYGPPRAAPRIQTPSEGPPRAIPRTQTPDHGPPKAAPRTQTPDYAPPKAAQATHSRTSSHGRHNSVSATNPLHTSTYIEEVTTSSYPPQPYGVPTSFEASESGGIEDGAQFSENQSGSAADASIAAPGETDEITSESAMPPPPPMKKEADADGLVNGKKPVPDFYVPTTWPRDEDGSLSTEIPRVESPVASPDIHHINQVPSSPPASHTSSPYAPPPQSYAPKQTTQTYDPYAPSRSTSYAPTAPATNAEPTPQPYAAQPYASQLASPPVVSNAYAPSPSLIGADDPLARVSVRAPVFSFGFGGRLVTCFHGAASLNTGFDVALSTRNTTSVKIQTLNKLLPKSALSESEADYPGPLYADPGTSSLSLRSTATSQAKTKKARIVQYLETRASEINQGLGYLNAADRRTAEAKLVLINLLKIMVENEGKLSGSPTVDNAVRSVLVPRLAESATGQAAAPGFTTLAVDPQNDVSGGIYSGGAVTSSFEQPISVTTLQPSALNKIEDLLMRGERKQAYVYALDQKLWAHAMVIASSIGKEAWKEVVNEFIQVELGAHDEAPGSASLPGSNDSAGHSTGRDSLRVVYRLFSGQGGDAAVQELAPKQSLSRPTMHLQPGAGLAPPPQLTPRTPAFPPPTFNNIPPESLSKWKETIAMMIASPLSPDASQTLSALGDQLFSCGWIEAAHACYLLSPLASRLGGSGTPGTRITLLGSKPPHLFPSFAKNPDHLIFSEILEYAMSLVPVAKGQEPFHGLNHLQPYRLLHATWLAELGYIQEANRYCDAITASIAKPSPYFTPTFVHQLRSLVDRISGVAHSEKSNSWIGGKISKPSLDSIGGWLEGRFTKLVTGDEDENSPKEGSEAAQQKPFDGPFAHYSTISTTPSARSSPQPRPPVPNPYGVPQRTSSAMAMSSPYQSYAPAPIDRASSAIDYIKHQRLGRQSPAPPVPPLPAHLSQGLGLNTNAAPANNAPHGSSPLASPAMETPVQQAPSSSWWDYTSGGGNATTPTATSFMKVDEPVAAEPSSDGFISLMDSQNFTYGATSPAAPSHTTPRYEEEEDIEDLGFGNSKKKDSEESEEGSGKAEAAKPEPAKAAPPPAEKKQEQQASGGGWLSRWWKGSKDEGSGGGPVKANLGEENSFYYDKELKRWVNKKAGAEEAKPAPVPPPPPSRAQTASPSKTAMRPSPLGNSTPPPPRASSAMGGMLSEGPPPARVRSNLVPVEAGGGTPPPPPMGGSRPPSAASMGGPPGGPPSAPGSGPPSRPSSGAAKKKNLRSRYVDVFQQENAAA